jgi:hypothetical protein
VAVSKLCLEDHFDKSEIRASPDPNIKYTIILDTISIVEVAFSMLLLILTFFRATLWLLDFQA